MADLAKVVKILVSVEDKASSEIKKVADNVSQAMEQAKNTANEAKKALDFEDVVPSIKKVSDEMMKLGTAGMGVAGAITYVGLELNKSIAAAGSVAGATAEQMKELETLAREIGRTTTVSAKQAADAMYYLASAGMKTHDIMTSLPAVTNLAAATFSDMALASQVVVNAMSQYKLASEDAAKVSDIFVSAISNSQATLQKLADSLKYAGPVASAFNMSLEQTVAAMMLFYNAGLSGEQAGTALRNILLSLSDPSKEAAEKIQQLGIALEQVDPSRYKLEDIAKRFAEAGVSANDLAQIVGKEAVAAMLTLVQNSSKLQELTALLSRSQGAAKGLADSMAQTPYGQYQMAINQLKELAYEAFPAVFQAISTLARPLMNLISWFNSLSDSTKEGIAQFLVYGSAIALVVGGVGKAIVTFAEMHKAIKTIMALDLAGTFKNWQAAVGSFSSATIAQLSGITAAVGLIIFNVSKAIELFQNLSKAAQIRQEAAKIKVEADLGQEVSALQQRIIALSREAAADLGESAKRLFESKTASSMPAAILAAIAYDTSGALGRTLQQHRDIRFQAQEIIRRYNVIYALDPAQIERELSDIERRIENEKRRMEQAIVISGTAQHKLDVPVNLRALADTSQLEAQIAELQRRAQSDKRTVDAVEVQAKVKGTNLSQQIYQLQTEAKQAEKTITIPTEVLFSYMKAKQTGTTLTVPVEIFASYQTSAKDANLARHISELEREAKQTEAKITVPLEVLASYQTSGLERQLADLEYKLQSRSGHQRVLGEYVVKVRLDASAFEQEWRHLGERIKQQVAEDVSRAGWWLT